VYTLLTSVLLAGAPAECRPLAGLAPAFLQRSIDAVGVGTVDGVRTSSLQHVSHMKFQSDRMYPPYLWTGYGGKALVDWHTGVLRIDRAHGHVTSSFIADSARRIALTPRGPVLMPLTANSFLDERAMDAWAVLADWRSARDAVVEGECEYRDYWRTVLTRNGAYGPERLFIGSQTGIPIKLERREPHTLWGDVLVEYSWSIWTPVKGTRALAPQFAFRMADGEVEHQRSFAEFTIVPRDSAVRISIPENGVSPARAVAALPDTVRVSQNTFLLVTPAYTNVVTLKRDTVFVLDAQTDQRRAAADSVWIGRLFPGIHPVVLVVTDVAWPHIAGVRYWLAHGATLVSHRTSQSFLSGVAARKWTLAPDALERNRSAFRFRMQPVTTSLSLAGGAVQIHAIDGVGSEGGLMVYLPDERFLYAGDYIQAGGPDSFTATYAREVAAAVRRAGVSPERFAAMHIGLTAWNTLRNFTGLPADAAIIR
jgi:hypothetical protein